jgi:hypothetical protein
LAIGSFPVKLPGGNSKIVKRARPQSAPAVIATQPALPVFLGAASAIPFSAGMQRSTACADSASN